MEKITTENGTQCIECGKFCFYEELTLDDSTSEGDGPEEYSCCDCL